MLILEFRRLNRNGATFLNFDESLSIRHIIPIRAKSIKPEQANRVSTAPLTVLIFTTTTV